MKKACLLLTVLLVAALLFTACGKVDPAAQDNPMPPVSDDSDKDIADNSTPKDDNNDVSDPVKPAPADPEPPADNTPPVEEIVCPYDAVTLKCIKSGGGYLPFDEGWKVEIVENELQFSFYTDGFIGEIYKLFKQIDMSLNPLPATDNARYTARFHLRDGDSEEIIDFTPPKGGIEYGTKRVWVKVSEEERRPLTIEASEKFMELCSYKGLDGDLFFCHNVMGSMFDWLCSLSNRKPILLYDENRELTAEQAAEQMLYELGKELTQPAVNRTFMWTEYSGWNFKLLSNKEEEERYRNNEYFRLWDLTDDQYVVLAGELRGKYVGLGNDGGPDPYFFLEYEAGIWRLWLRERP